METAEGLWTWYESNRWNGTHYETVRGGVELNGSHVDVDDLYDMLERRESA